MKKESKFQAELRKELKQLFPGCHVLKTDANDIQGYPDLIILYKRNWAALECKREEMAYRRQNQEYYINECNDMSFAAFICPENKEDVLDELQHAFRPRRATRVFKS